MMVAQRFGTGKWRRDASVPAGRQALATHLKKNDPALLVLGHCRDYIRRGSHGTETQGEEAQSLFVEGDSVVSLTLYSSLVLLALCAAVIATDLTTRVYGTRLHYAKSRRGVP